MKSSRLILISSSAFLLVLGITLIFIPKVLLSLLNFSIYPLIILRLIGALFFGFSMLNWTARNNSLRGIYGKPITIGNFAHFFIGSLALIHFIIFNPQNLLLLLFALIYIIFAITFAVILFKK